MLVRSEGRNSMLNPSSILRLDIAGRPVDWIPWQEAVCFYVKDQVAWEIGEHNVLVHGGCSRLTGMISSVRINSIIAIRGKVNNKAYSRQAPHLNNRELFRRDGNVCLYCGESFRDSDLTRDHIVPRSQNGVDKWTNVVAACRRCNVAKGGRTPEEANMPLLAIPFAPNPAEYLALKNRRILADQMQFLKKQFRHLQLLDVI
jgi:5-methylcytosine-specific restriction endonuclease McrA